MTPGELAAIKARAEAATPGPWDTVLSRHVVSHADAFRGAPDWPLMPKTVADATFISHARTDVPALVAEVERLRAVCDGVAQKLLGTELDALVRQGHEFLPDAVESLRAHRDSLVHRMRMT